MMVDHCLVQVYIQSSSIRSAQVMLGTFTTLNISFGGEPESRILFWGPTHLMDEVDRKDMLSFLQTFVILFLCVTSDVL